MPYRKARLFFLIFISLLTGFLAFIPGYNGDMSFYIATAMNFEGKSDQQAVSETRQLIESELKGEKSALHLHNLDQSDNNLLNYYRIKPLYIMMVVGLHRLGIPYIPATRVPSLISFFLIGCMAFFWASKKFRPSVALTVTSVFMLMGPSLILARLSSPDALSNLIILICMYRVYFGKKYLWTGILLMISILIRLDNFIAAGIVLSLMHFWPEKEEKTFMPVLPYITFLVVAGIIGLWVNYYFTNNFWWFRDVGYTQSLQSYGYQVLIYCASLSASMIPVLLLMICFVWLNRPAGLPTRTVYFLAGIGIIIFTRFLFFPSLEDRFMTAFYLCILLLVLELYSNEKFSQKHFT
jgi:putative flippase GtrA